MKVVFFFCIGSSRAFGILVRERPLIQVAEATMSEGDQLEDSSEARTGDHWGEET